jgi:AcrR family transcriptional regulator
MKRDPENRARWLEAGFAALREGGNEALRIDALARRVGLTKGSFYHHFGGREGYLEALLDRWEESSTRRVIRLTEQSGPTLAKLEQLHALTDALDHRLEVALRGLGDTDERVRVCLARVDEARIAYLTQLAEALGQPAQEARFLAELGYLAYVGAQLLGRLPQSASWNARLADLLLHYRPPRSPLRSLP